MSLRLLLAYALAASTVLAACGGVEDDADDLAADEAEVTSVTNVNVADVKALDKVPYVSTTVAKAIYADRQAHGLFWSKQDLLRVKGVTQTLLTRIDKRITVGDSCRRQGAPYCGQGQYCRVRTADAGSISALGLCVPNDATPPATCSCAQVYQPVCGNDGHTYSNACLASCANVGYSLGECAVHECVCRSNCAQQVCGTDHKTYANASEAACAGVPVASNGACH